MAGAFVMLQGVAEIVRCVVCLRTGVWPSRLKDASELDVIEEQLAHSEHVDDGRERTPSRGPTTIEEAARQRGAGDELRS